MWSRVLMEAALWSHASPFFRLSPSLGKEATGRLVVTSFPEGRSALLPRLHRPMTTVGWAAGDNPPAGRSAPARRQCGGPAPEPRGPADLGAAGGRESLVMAGAC